MFRPRHCRPNRKDESALDDNKVIIIGGGIGGLTAAVALQQRDIPVVVHEKQPEIRELGTGVGIQRVARQAISMLGLEEPLRSIEGERYEALRHVSYKNGRTLAMIPWHRAVAAVHRGDLLEVLKEALPDQSIVRCASECVGFEQDPGGGVTARFTDGREDRGIALIGADGLHSVVRKQVVNDGEPRYGGWTVWRGMPEYTHPSLAPDMAEQVWGPASVFGMYPVRSRLFWYAGATRPEGAGDPPGGRKRDLLSIFGDWPEAVPEVIESTPEEIIDRQDVYDRDPVSRWSDRRVTLLGDAAHPTMPSLGQGAGMAIEDGTVVARELAPANVAETGGAVEGAFKRYEEMRILRTAGIVKRSRKMSRLNSLKLGPLVTVRETVQSSLPQSFWQRLWEHEGTYQL
jgi:2-polyprenyl-6-methoxyphenol hydroxylase-like FAD-dependent oxidoreductase